MARTNVRKIEVPEKFLKKNFVNSSDLAEILGVSKPTISNWKRQHRIHASIMDGKVEFFSIEYIETLIEEIYDFGRPKERK